MRATHAQTSFAATRQFTDREDATALFLQALREPQAKNVYRVLNWHGVGGQGKSALSRELLRLTEAEAAARRATEDIRIGAARVNFEDKRMRRSEEALLSIRLQLARTFGQHFPAFDTGFARFFVLTNPGFQIRRAHPELFRGENEFLGDLIDWSEVGVDSAVDGISLAVPGLNIIYKHLSRASARVHEWLKRRGRAVLHGLDDLSPDEIAERLPTYLGSDICHLLDADKPVRIAIFCDTHEALWREHNVKDSVAGARADSWLRLLVQDAPGALFAIFGRDRLAWPRIDAGWDGALQSHLLGPLSDEDGDRFLRNVPITSPQVRAAIVAGARGLPFYLDLQIDLFESLIGAGGYPDALLFGGSHPKILRRFLDHLGMEDHRTLRLASYPLILSEALMTELAESFLGGIGYLDWGQLMRFSFFEPDGAGGALMHAVMRDALQLDEKGERAETYRRVHSWLHKRYAAETLVHAPGQVTLAHENAFTVSLHHLIEAGVADWLPMFRGQARIFEKAGRYRVLEVTHRRVLQVLDNERRQEDLDLLSIRHDLAEQISAQGRYREAEQEFRAVLQIRRRADVLGEEHPDTLLTRSHVASVLDELGCYREAESELRQILAIQQKTDLLGEQHPDALATRRLLAAVMLSQGHYGDAGEEFGAILKIQRQPDVLGEEHPETLSTRSHVASVLNDQGRYQEAEDELRQILEIQCRPEVYGEMHRETLATRHLLAVVSANQGRYREAEMELRAVLEMQRRSDMLGEEHPETLRTRLDRASVLEDAARYEEAEFELRQILDIQRRPDVLGEEARATLTTRYMLAAIIGRQGHNEEAEQEFRAIYDIERRPDVLGENHPDTLKTRYHIASMLDDQGRYPEAETELRQILEIQRRPDVLGSEHRETLVSRYLLAVVMGKQGHHRDAEDELRAVLEIERRPEMLGEEHPATLRSRYRLAWVIGEQGRYGEAEAELKEIWRIERRPDVLGEEHPNTLRTRYRLARMLDAQGRVTEADLLLEGLGAMMGATLDTDHRWISEINAYLEGRRTAPQGKQ